MAELLEAGSDIAAIARQYTQYAYWDVYSEVPDFSLRGKKHKITGRLNKLKSAGQRVEREKLVADIQVLVDSIYAQSRTNGKKIVEILKVLGK